MSYKDVHDKLSQLKSTRQRVYLEARPDHVNLPPPEPEIKKPDMPTEQVTFHLDSETRALISNLQADYMRRTGKNITRSKLIQAALRHYVDVFTRG